MTYMKRIYILSLLAVLLCACQDEENKAPLFLKTELEENILNIPIEGKSEQVDIYTNLDILTLSPVKSEGYDWCRMEIFMTASEKNLLTITVSPNKGAGKREAEFSLSGKGVEPIHLKIVQLGTTPDILVDSESKTLTAVEQEFSLKVTANVAYELMNNKDWLQLQETNDDTRAMAEKVFHYKVSKNNGLAYRRDTIYIKTMEDGTPLVVKVPVEQEPSEIDDVIPEDIKVKVASVVLIQGNTYGKSVIGNTIDGDLGTAYSSAKGDNRSVIVEFTLEDGTERVDYVVLHQNKVASSPNQLTKGTLYYKSAVVTEWTQCATFDETEIVPSIRLDVKVGKPLKFKLELARTQPELPALPNVSFAEFECYQFAEGGDFNLEADMQYFEDDVFSVLKAGVTVEDIHKITHPMVKAVAQELLNQTYTKEFRSRTYKSCKDPSVVGQELTIGKRSICDNPTGLFFQKDKTYVVFVGSSIGEGNIKLFIKDWRENGGQQTIALKAGLNMIVPTIEGMGYIQYWTPTDASLPAVNIHVCYGNEIGFWDLKAGHTNADWKRILPMAVTKSQQLNLMNAMIDVLGEHVQLVNTVNAFSLYCPDDIEAILDMHDELMLIEYSMMGLVKYNAVPANRMLGVRSWSGNPSWNGTSANYPNDELVMLNKAAFLNQIWLFGHEFGHGNQVSQMKTAGWAEVTNNIYAQEAMYRMNNGECRIEHGQYKRAEYGDNVYGDRFNAYFHESMIDNHPYLTHGGEFVSDERGEYYSLDPFMTLAPLWQLSLFFQHTNKSVPWHKPDFWADVHWGAINDHTNTSSNYGLQYMNFMKRAMDACGYNLCDFFEKMSLLHEMDMRVGGYGDPKRVTITKAMMDEIKAYGKKYASIPENAMIHYISGNSLEFFNKRQPVQGVYGQGITETGSSKVISHAVWKNAVVYETYANDKLMEVGISGTGSVNNSSTLVRYPEGATRIEAVAWNGQRTLVFGSR